MGQNENKAKGGPSADPDKTRQWAGHLRHLKHLAEQRAEYKARSLGARRGRRRAERGGG